jgi:hypothetical protein
MALKFLIPMNSYLVQRLSAVKRNEPTLLLASERMIQITLYSWTRVLLIAARHTVDEPGPYVAGKPLARHFFVEDDGEFYMQSIIIILLMFFCPRFSVLPALSLNDGIIHCDIIEGSFDTELFYTFIDRLLDQMQPFPAPNSVIVMDNCRIHKHPAIVELIESRYVFYSFVHDKY